MPVDSGYMPVSITDMNLSCRSMLLLQTLDLSKSVDTFGAGCFSALTGLKTLDLSSCVNAHRDALLTLPVGVTSLSVDNCEQLEVDDELLSKVRVGKSTRPLGSPIEIECIYALPSPAILITDSSQPRSRTFKLCRF